MIRNFEKELRRNGISKYESYSQRDYFFKGMVESYKEVVISFSIDFIYDSPHFTYAPTETPQQTNPDIFLMGILHHTKIYMDYTDYLKIDEFEGTNDINSLIYKIKNKKRKEKIRRLINDYDDVNCDVVTSIKKEKATIVKKETIKDKINNLIKKIIK